MQFTFLMHVQWGYGMLMREHSNNMRNFSCYSYTCGSYYYYLYFYFVLPHLLIHCFFEYNMSRLSLLWNLRKKLWRSMWINMSGMNSFLKVLHMLSCFVCFSFLFFLLNRVFALQIYTQPKWWLTILSILFCTSQEQCWRYSCCMGPYNSCEDSTDFYI